MVYQAELYVDDRIVLAITSPGYVRIDMPRGKPTRSHSRVPTPSPTVVPPRDFHPAVDARDPSRRQIQLLYGLMSAVGSGI